MYLKRLEINGFKSFGDRTEIFLQPGLNIIVGPNGCGKSNVVDAIRWVLGESNVHHLRGQKNEELIFNGSDKKKPLGMAIVEMTIDNSDHALDIEFAELNMVRKIFRTGESEYYINKSCVRMKDVVKLFAGTGLGKQGYSIISQGELEDVLNGQSFDRRLMLEEAAGTIKYRMQRDEVQRRILTTSNDLVRAEDILEELITRKDELALKAEKAKEYMGLQTELSDLERKILASEILSNGNQLEQKGAEYQHKGEDKEKLNQQVQTLKKILTEEENDLGEIRRVQSECLQQKHEEVSAQQSSASELKLSQERIRNYQERIGNASTDADKYRTMIKGLEQDLAEKINGLQSEKASFAGRQDSLLQLEQEISVREQEIESLSASFENQKYLVFEKAQREVDVKNQLTDRENEIKKCREKRERVFIHVQSNTDKIKQMTSQITQMDEIKKANLHDLQEVKKDLETLEQQVGRRQAEKRTLESEMAGLNREQVSLDNKLLAYGELEKNFTGYSETVRTILKSYEKGEPNLQGLIGIVANLIDVPAGMELAIDVAVGRGLENIVVQSARNASRAIEFLKRNHLGRATFLPLDVLKAQPLSAAICREITEKRGVVGIASQLIRYDRKVAKAMEYLFGRVLIVGTMDDGLAVFKTMKASLRIVTLEGDLINASGAMTGGTQSRKSSSPLQRKGEEKNMLGRLKTLKDLQAEKETHLTTLSKKLDDYLEKVSEHKNRQSELSFQNDMVEQEYTNIETTLKNCQMDNTAYQREISDLERSVRKFESEMIELQETYEHFRQENVSFSEEIEGLKANLEEYRREFELRKERHKSQYEGLQMKKNELEKLEKHIEQFRQVEASYANSLSDAESLMKKLHTEIEAQEKYAAQSQASMSVGKEHLDELEAQLKQLQKEEAVQLGQIEQNRASLIPLQENLVLLEENHRSLQMRVVRLETEWDGLKSRWQEKFGSENWGTYHILTASVLREFRKKTEGIADQLEQVGNVDLAAIEDYAKLKERFDFLQRQSKDLKEARDSLQNLVQETERMMTKSFNEFIIKANNSFHQTFTDIFGGGDAALVVETDGDLFSAGIDIEVKMPGKRIQSLNLLSGGEKALTCIAFIFSLLRLKPTPFCLLDEIDAALDETNLLRFSSFIKNMSREMQFIIISHRQATIESGSVIYGVTMPQEGVSSILSLQFEDLDSIAG